jgi:hypothetical protein
MSDDHPSVRWANELRFRAAAFPPLTNHLEFVAWWVESIGAQIERVDMIAIVWRVGAK